jgi:cob(I)alamin adenosyltransferase
MSHQIPPIPPIDFSKFFGHQNTVLAIIHHQLTRMENRMAENDQQTSAELQKIQADLAAAAANVAETNADVKALLGINQQQTDSIAAMEVTIHQLQQEVGDRQAITMLASQVSDLKSLTRQAADLYTPVAVETPPVTTEPAPAA